MCVSLKASAAPLLTMRGEFPAGESQPYKFELNRQRTHGESALLAAWFDGLNQNGRRLIRWKILCRNCRVASAVISKPKLPSSRARGWGQSVMAPINRPGHAIDPCSNPWSVDEVKDRLWLGFFFFFTLVATIKRPLHRLKEEWKRS